MKKVLFALLCCLCLNISVVHAQNEKGIAPRALAVSCGECGLLLTASPISTRTETTTATCVHGKSGDDSVRYVYTRYEVSCSGHYHEEFERKTSTTVLKCLGK